MKVKIIFLCMAITLSVFAGCTPNDTTPEASPAPQATATPAAETPPEDSPSPEISPTPEGEAVDAETTASIVKDKDAFLNAISKNGTWIIATLNDLQFDQDLVLEGEFKNDDGEIARKIALYTQDDNRKVTNRFKLTAPKLTVRSENARIQSGTFIGDVYVEAKNFSLVDAKVEGNVYFTKDEYKSSFKLDEGGTVSGKTEVKK